MFNPAKPVVTTYVGADGRTLSFKATDYLGADYDLTGLTLTITANYSNATKIDDAACTVTGAATGEFEYTPTAAEIDEAGQYDAQIKIEDGGGLFDWFEPIIIDVRAPIAPIV